MKTNVLLIALMIGLSSCSKKEETATPAPAPVVQPILRVVVTGTLKKPQFDLFDTVYHRFGLDGTTTNKCYNFIAATAVKLPYERLVYKTLGHIKLFSSATDNTMACNWDSSDTLIFNVYKDGFKYADTITFERIKNLGDYTYYF